MHVTIESGLECTLFNTADNNDRITMWLEVELERHMHTSECYHHLVIWTNTSVSLEIVMLSSSCDSKFMIPKRRFWKDEQKMKCGFTKFHKMMIADGD
jgi:hypothetical protein